MKQITPGLVSITFRQLKAAEIIELCQQAKLEAIEWGGDVHVPHGDLKVAKEVAAMTADAGMQVAAYGSYYRVGVSEHDGLAFETVLETAQHLQAPSIRVWPGNRGSANSDDAYRQWIISELQRISEMAAPTGIPVTLEYHAGTLTDTDASARKLLDEIGHPNCRTLWQPPNGQDFEKSMEGLRAVLPDMQNVHVFHWWPTNQERHELEAGRDRWINYLELATDCGHPFYALLEFVKDDRPQQLLEDASTLREWIEEIQRD
jgi:sugar phosphate isomerase/epimerase